MNNSIRVAALNSPAKQRGLGLISAIFVITVMALLASGVASLVANSANIHSWQMLSMRAQSAAASGLEIKLAALGDQPNCGTDSIQYSYNTPGLYQCSAAVSCSSVKHQNKIYITLDSRGSCGTGLETAEKTLQKRILKSP
ncbi:MAG: hypothetical protein OFPI_44900 [Osedax symbiont Rs2]|nr:MAG: hypothetical protein OFPI_44900 [Osedax symbiont Rs2]